MKKLFTCLIFINTLLLSFNAVAVPKLNSLPGAIATIFLDFDGHYVQSSVWNGGNPINCAPSGMNDPQITEAFNRVAEDYRPFVINITTDSAVFLAAPLNRRIRIIITTTSEWYPGVGGVAYVSSFTWGDDTPAFVFSNLLGPYSPKMVGECCSHESGHTVGLSHQSKYDIANCTTPVEPYNSGAGSGETGWSPIMGNSYYRNMTNWNNGPTPNGCTSMQDNLSIIATQNGFTYRADDYDETLGAGTYTLAAPNYTVNGIIATNSDKDAFRFSLAQNQNIHLRATPFNVSSNYIGANLDIKLELYNSSAGLIRTYDPVNAMSVIADTVLNAGTYYLKIDGTGNTNIGEYGSLGSYSISVNMGTLPIHTISLSGNEDKNKHNLKWNIIADEPVKTLVIESSDDGSLFAPLTTVAPTAANFSYQPYKNTMVYYRLKATSMLDQTAYSNTIVLRGISNTGKYFSVYTLVQNELSITAAGNYQFLLSDINGRTVASGTGVKGISKVNVSNLPGGMYIIQLFSDNEKQTERIIKQ